MLCVNVCECGPAPLPLLVTASTSHRMVLMLLPGLFLLSNPFTKDDSSLLVATVLIQLKIKFFKF